MDNTNNTTANTITPNFKICCSASELNKTFFTHKFDPDFFIDNESDNEYEFEIHYDGESQNVTFHVGINCVWDCVESVSNAQELANALFAIRDQFSDFDADEIEEAETASEVSVSDFIGCYAPHINGVDCNLLESIQEYLQQYGQDLTFDELMNLPSFFVSEKSDYAPEVDLDTYILTVCAAIGQYITNNDISVKQQPTPEAIKLFAQVYGYDYEKFIEVFEFSSHEELGRNCTYLDKVIGQISSDDRIENHC